MLQDPRRDAGLSPLLSVNTGRRVSSPQECELKHGRASTPKEGDLPLPQQ